MNLCHYAVHTPIQVKDEDRERFEKKAREQGLDQETAWWKENSTIPRIRRDGAWSEE